MSCNLEIQDLSYTLEGKEILHDISLSLHARRIGVIGRNGSGKSTFARLVAGLISPSRGTVTLNDVQVDRDRRGALRNVGILFQNPDHQIIFPTVLEEIAFGLEQLGQSKDEAASGAMAALEQFGLGHWQHAYINTLSQGQKHLVCLMSVKAMSPRLLILDEPFAGLDIPTRAQLNRYLSQYDGSLLHITHAPADLDGYEHLVWLDEGRVALSGPHSTVMPAYLSAMDNRGGSNDLADLSG